MGKRLVVMHALVIALVAGQLASTAAFEEWWPFSHYPMYAAPHRSTTWTNYAYYGITDSGEIALDPAECFYPLDHMRLKYAVRRRHRQGRWTQLADALLAMCEHNRKAGRLSGEPLRGVRIYRERWNLRDGSPRPVSRRIYLPPKGVQGQ